LTGWSSFFSKDCAPSLLSNKLSQDDLLGLWSCHLISAAVRFRHLDFLAIEDVLNYFQGDQFQKLDDRLINLIRGYRLSEGRSKDSTDGIIVFM
jgi:hypothetical protein